MVNRLDRPCQYEPASREIRLADVKPLENSLSYWTRYRSFRGDGLQTASCFENETGLPLTLIGKDEKTKIKRFFKKFQAIHSCGLTQRRLKTQTVRTRCCERRGGHFFFRESGLCCQTTTTTTTPDSLLLFQLQANYVLLTSECKHVQTCLLTPSDEILLKSLSERFVVVLDKTSRRKAHRKLLLLFFFTAGYVQQTPYQFGACCTGMGVCIFRISCHIYVYSFFVHFQGPLISQV